VRKLKRTPTAAKQYKKLARKDPQLKSKVDAKILELLNAEDPGSLLEVTGKPHKLKGNLNGWWGVTTKDGNRIVYKFDTETLIIASLVGHYGDH